MAETIHKEGKELINMIYEEYYEPFTYYAFRYLNDSDLAKDIVQEAYLSVISMLETHDRLKHPKTYFYTTIRNLCLNYSRNIQIHLRHHEQIKAHMYLPNIEEEIIESETKYQITNAITQLSVQQQKVIIMSMRGYQNEEIANALNVSINTVKTNKQRAYKNLKKKMENI